MDPNHAVFDQLPDESTIERIFAKCPPKQNSQRKSNQSRRVASTSSSAAAAAAAASSSSSVAASKETSKRQTRSRRQHRSRREVEGRRIKGRSAFKDNGGDTSDSSGANVASGKKYDYSLVDPSPRLNNNNNNNNNNNTINSLATRRESERYVIHKSQSNHEDISCRSQLGSRMTTEPIHGPRMVHYGHNARDRRAAPASRCSEIVKSSSSHAFGNYETNHSKVQGPAARQDEPEQLSPLSSGRPRDGIVRLVGAKCARDLMDNNNNNNNNNNTSSEAADNHDLNNLELFSSNTKLNNNDLDKPPSELELVKNINTSSRQDELIAAEMNAKAVDVSRPTDGNSHASGQREAASLESAATRQRQLQHPSHLTSPTADLEFRHNIVADGAKKDPANKSTSDPIYINRAPDSTLQASPPDDSKVIIRRRHDLLDNNSPETPTNIDSTTTTTTATRDANKYINLLIYDSPAQETEGNNFVDKRTSTGIDSPRSSIGAEAVSLRSPESSNLNNRIVGLDGVAEQEDRLVKEKFGLNTTNVSDSSASHKQQQQQQQQQQRLRSSPKAVSHKDEPAENFTESWKSESQPDFNIISVHHQASQQLLTTTDSSENDPNIVRNDTSSEELCSSNAATDLNPNDVDDATKRASNSLHSTDSSLTGSSATASTRAPSHQKNHFSDPDTANSRFVQQTRHSPVASIGGSLQTVDESPEVVEDTQQPDHRTGIKGVICNEEELDEAMSTGQPNLARRSITPPGFPQRIRPNQKTNQDTAREASHPELVGLGSKVKPETQPASGLDLSQQQQQPSTPIPEIIARPSRLEGQRVKFNDENLVSVRDDSIQPSPDNGQKAGDKGAGGSCSHLPSARREHSPLMPIIKEAQNETEFEAQNFHAADQQEQELTTSLSKKLSLSSQSSGEFPLAAAAARDDLDPLAATLERDPARTTSNEQPQSLDQLNATGISGDVADCKPRETDSASQQTNLRHHRLPNESSHYSIVRTNRDSGTNNSASAGAEQQLNSPAPRYSSIQFNSLSDAESEPEDSLSATVGSNLRKSGAPNPAGPRSYVTVQRYEQPGQQQPQQQLGENRTVSAQGQVNDAAQAADSDAPIASPQIKQAMVFPRLDDGLSSEPESCDDEVEDDDERAMDADIDADEDDEDDDEDDDGVDDDVEDTLNSLDRRAIQTNMDNLLRQQQQQRQQQHHHHQQQQRKNTTGRGHSQHHVVTPLYNLAVGDHPSGSNQMKAGPGSAASYYPSSGQQQDHTNDHHAADLIKGSQNYSGQNGQSSSYWMGPAGASSNHSTVLSSSSQQHSFNNQRSAVANNANSFSNSSSSINNNNNKDEAKAINRLSSDTDNETDRLLGSQRGDQQLKLASNEATSNNSSVHDIQPLSNSAKQSANSKEVLIEGVLFNVKYLGSTHSECEGRSEKEDRILQAEMAVKEVKFRNGESQSAVEVQLFISTEKIMVLDDKHRKIMMDHSLRTISYIADIGDAIVLIVRKKSSSSDATNELGRPVPKISCHVFESSESHTITKSISQAFQVAYAELVKANGTGDSANYMPRELDYQEVLNSQEMSTDEIEMFARKENQREVIVPKNENEILGISIVESGWGSVLPTVVIASLKHDGPAYRCKKLSIGDQILSVNGISLVGLPLAECQEILRKTKSQRVARLSVVPCPITVEVKIKRPDTKYQLGFSVQNGVICSLLRGGIAERGGVRVGHRIMSINGTTVVGVPHEKIVTLLASSVGEIRMKTCLTSLYRHMLGEENPVHI